jgi:prepilin-type N-terminal cleavage/methylation domain-containing protein
MHFLQQESFSKAARSGGGLHARAFTLVEMLVVLVIIGIISAIAIPYLPGLAKSNSMSAANQQLLSDIAYARQRAIADHTKVYMIFLPGEFWNNITTNGTFPASTTANGTNADSLISGQFTSYALFSFRSLGDQPGQSYPRYLTSWRTLPDGVIIETNKFGSVPETFANLTDPTLPGFTVKPFDTNFFYFPPSELTNDAVSIPNKLKVMLPYIGFDSQGRLLARNGQSLPEDEYISLAAGSVFVPRDPQTDRVIRPPLGQPTDVVETAFREATRTNYNLVHIDWLTGRAKIEKPELK